jgi:ferredoxin-type protein NapH
MSSKWWIFRYASQIAILFLIASPLVGFTFFRGNLAAADLLGLPIADPLAFLQAIIGGRVFVFSYFTSALLVSLFYFILGGRSFCAWICPVGLITEFADKLFRRQDCNSVTIPLETNRWILLLVLITVASTGIPLFEVLSPIGIINRAIAFASLMPLLLLAAILLLETVVARRIWCRSLCPLGGFYSILARFSPLRIGFKKELCTHCNDCLNACPVHEVLTPPLDLGARQVTAGDCSRCMACIDTCPEKALIVDFFYK